MDFIFRWGAAILTGVILSGIAASLVERFTGDFLKKILFTIKISKLKFSVSLFVIITIIVRYFFLPNV